MALTRAQLAIIAKAKSVGGGELGIALTDDECSFLLGTIIEDLGLTDKFPELPDEIPSFFGTFPLSAATLLGINFIATFERLLDHVTDADTYFHCLATLQKARRKYERILQVQAVPTLSQVGPRGLLQYGSLSPRALTGFLLWRKWIYDIDNRAAQETGYVFEPIIAASIGGVPVSAAKSPIRRVDDPKKGRQVDCIRPDGRAYEIKLRVTIAASGQGRWREELAFPEDCKFSKYLPVLVVLDQTPNPKLDQLRERFLAAGGEVYIGEAAWQHFDELAGPTMSRFLDKYVRAPIQALLAEVSDDTEGLPDLTLRMSEKKVSFSLLGETLEIDRDQRNEVRSDEDELPPDVDEGIPGP